MFFLFSLLQAILNLDLYRFLQATVVCILELDLLLVKSKECIYTRPNLCAFCKNAITYPCVPLVRSISVMVTSCPWSLLSLRFVVFLTFFVFFSVMVKLEWTSTSPIFFWQKGRLIDNSQTHRSNSELRLNSVRWVNRWSYSLYIFRKWYGTWCRVQYASLDLRWVDVVYLYHQRPKYIKYLTQFLICFFLQIKSLYCSEL